MKIWQLCLDFMVKVLMDWKLNLYVGLKKMKFVYEFKMKVLDYLQKGFVVILKLINLKFFVLCFNCL